MRTRTLPFKADSVDVSLCIQKMSTVALYEMGNRLVLRQDYDGQQYIMTRGPDRCKRSRSIGFVKGGPRFAVRQARRRD